MIEKKRVDNRMKGLRNDGMDEFREEIVKEWWKLRIEIDKKEEDEMRENGDGGGNKSSKRKEEIDKIMEVGKEILKMEDKDDEKSMEIMLE